MPKDTPKGPRLDQSGKRPIDELFFHPGQHPGLSFLEQPQWMWKEVPLGRLAALPIASFEEINARSHRVIETHFQRRLFRSGIAFNTVPALVADLFADGSNFAVGGRWLLNGASGTRIRNRLIWQNAETRAEYDRAVVDHLADACEQAPQSLPVAPAPDRPVDYVIDCRNYFAFYHFLTEALPHLCLAKELPNLGRIIFQSGTGKQSGFIHAWVEALFPELADRVSFAQGLQHYDLAYIPMNTRHLYYQVPETVMPSFHHLAPDGFRFYGRKALRNVIGTVGMNSYDVGLKHLRTHALTQAARIDTSGMPRKFWVSRAATGPRDRTMRGQKAMLEALKARGFEEVFFEKLQPLEQIALMNQAEVMISYHGAGFANMMFAGPQTTCIELGTLQTAMFRWPDFMQHAHVSGCRYVSFYADFKQPDPSQIPNLRSNNLVSVALAKAGRETVLGFIDALADPEHRGEAEVLLPTAQLLQQLQEYDRLDHLLAANAASVQSSADLMAIKARQFKRRGNLRAAVRDLQAAWALDQKRPFLLEQLTLTAEMGGRWAMVRALRAEHHERFPDRHQNLVRRIRQMRHRKALEAEAAAGQEGA